MTGNTAQQKVSSPTLHNNVGIVALGELAVCDDAGIDVLQDDSGMTERAELDMTSRWVDHTHHAILHDAVVHL